MIAITDMALLDLDAVYGVETRSFSIPWSKNELRRELAENPLAYYKVARVDGTVAGYAGLWHVVDEGHICNIAVDEPFRRKGVGAALVTALVALAQEKKLRGLTLEVRMGNTAAQKLYHKFGFVVEGLRKNFYNDPKEDAVIMWKYF